MFPLYVNLKDRLCVVVGAGKVGLRRARLLSESSAKVRMICLEFRPDQGTIPEAEWLAQPYGEDHLEGAFLVFAAAGPELNERVVRDAKRRGLQVNSASDPAVSDFHVPAVVRRGGFLLAIGTGGAAPNLTRRVRQQLDEQFDEAFGRWVAVLRELRETARALLPDRAIRQAALARLCDRCWLERLRSESTDAVRRTMLADLQALAGPSVKQV